MPAPQRFVCKILCPDGICGSFIGDKGHRINDLEDSTNTIIHVSSRREFFPGLQGERVIAVSGFDADSIYSVIAKVQDTVTGCGGRANFQPQCILVVTNDGAGYVLGAGGARVSQIAKKFHGNIRINIQKSSEIDPGINERYVEIISGSGTYGEDIKDCAREIISMVCQKGVKQPGHLQRYHTSATSPPSTTRSSSLKPTSSTQHSCGNYSSSAKHGIIYSTWDDLMDHAKRHTNRKPSDASLEEEHAIDCSVIANGVVMKYVGGQWHEAKGYTIYAIRRDSRGEPVYELLG